MDEQSTILQVFDPVSLPDNIRASSSEREASWSNWSIRTLFGIGITSACPMATESSIFIKRAKRRKCLESNRNNQAYIYERKSSSFLNLIFSSVKSKSLGFDQNKVNFNYSSFYTRYKIQNVL